MMGIVSAISNNLQDARALGWGFLGRQLAKGVHHWTIPGVGPATLRPGTTDAEVFRQVFTHREYDLSRLRRLDQVRAMYDAILEEDRVPLIIDAGANIGVASLWFAHQFPRAQIIAIEPEPANAALCRQNVSTLTQIRVEEAAVGASAGYITLDNPAQKAWSPRSERSDHGIPIVTIGDLVASVPRAELLIAKIDIEGFESDLFAANLKWLDAARVVIVEIHDWMMPGRQTSFSLQRAMADRQFEMMICGENLVYIVNANQRSFLPNPIAQR
jgi:FkbM family methyltransferase